MNKKLLILMIVVLFLGAGAGYGKDLRAVKLEKFLSRYPKSPLKGHEQEILYWADYFNVDYRLYLAIAGAESTFGRKYPKHNHNLTGVLNGTTRFASIQDNIYKTTRLIATGKWYGKYRKTKNIRDLVYVYKGVPPYDRYIRTMRYTFSKIASISVADEQRKQSWLKQLDTSAFVDEIRQQAKADKIVAWNSIRYDQYRPGKKVAVDINKIPRTVVRKEPYAPPPGNRIGMTTLAFETDLAP